MRTELELLRREMAAEGIDAYLIVSDDDHASEYVGEYYKCRAFVSGFDGSAGTLVVLQEEAGLWTDGRYFIQAEQQLAGSGITLYRSGEPGVPAIEEFLASKLSEGMKLGADGTTVAMAQWRRIVRRMSGRQISYRTDVDLCGRIWQNRPARPGFPAWVLEERYAGESSSRKLARVREALREDKADYLLVTALDEIAWLLNIRGTDIAYSPVVLSFFLLGHKEALWYVQPEALTPEVRAHAAALEVECRPYEQIYEGIAALPAGTVLRLDDSGTNVTLYQAIPREVEKKKAGTPIQRMKAVKNEVEQENMRIAHYKDGIALTRLIYWLKQQTDKEGITELDVCRKLEEYRREGEHYLGQSFAPIAACGAHGAIVHYEPDEGSNCPLTNERFLLLDTGGHYLEGTTDVTRTIVLGALTREQKHHYTAVLKGNLNLGAAVFRHGCSGVNLDYLARAALWNEGLDYNHGTGHGVGYLLNVHEGPNAIRFRERSGSGTVLEEGMITSNEPGLYLKGRYGIRLENLILCRKRQENEYGTFLEFETLTLVPFDMEAVLWEELSLREQELLKAYQKRVYDTLKDGLPEDAAEWLRGQMLQ